MTDHKTATAAFAAALLALAACADTSEPADDPAAGVGQNGYDMIDPVVEPVASEPLPPGPGTWEQAHIEGRQGLVFRPAEGEPPLALFCDERDGLVFERRGLLPTGPYRMMHVAVGNDRFSMAVNEVANDGPVLRATAPFNSELHTRLREPSASMSVTMDRSEPILVPGGQPVAELVRACTTAAPA